MMTGGGNLEKFVVSGRNLGGQSFGYNVGDW